jgi:hypothetical protein
VPAPTMAAGYSTAAVEANIRAKPVRPRACVRPRVATDVIANCGYTC